jgi:hypothetical protein
MRFSQHGMAGGRIVQQLLHELLIQMSPPAVA